MRRFINVLLIVMFALTIMSSQTYAQEQAKANTEVTVDLKDLDDVTRIKILDMMNDKKEEAAKKATEIIPVISKVDPATIKSWAESISGVIKTICGELNVSVNDFIKTDAGKITIFLVAYKMIGDDVRAIIFSTLWALIFLPLIIFSLRIFHIPTKRKTKDKDGNEVITYEVRYDWQSGDCQTTSAVLHYIAIAAVLFILLVAWVG